MRVIIAGGREYELSAEDLEVLDRLKTTLPISEVVCGMARGADLGGRDWALANGIPVREFPADWQGLGRKAGPIRNQAMADYAEALVAFPGGKGTADMVTKATARGLKVVRTGRLEASGTDS